MSLPSSADAPLRRYAPGRSFPPYTYVPGAAPHPLRDAAGHSHGLAPAHPAPIDDANWHGHGEYLFAVDLFNHGYYWEAHEAWEAIWHACGRRGPTADLLKGLIKLAAAGVKVREAQPVGVARHIARAIELLTFARDGGAPRLGLALDRVIAAAQAMLSSPPPTWVAAPSVVRPLPGLQLVLGGEPRATS